jgi:molecular chaperone GrpE
MNTSPEHEDIDFEPEDEMGTLGAAKVKMQKLRDELEKAKSERQEYLDGWQRCKADSVNMKKDLAFQAERQAERKLEGVIEDILPALDSFDMAMSGDAWEKTDSVWRSGMENVRNQLIEGLRRHGVDRFGAVGEAYDPHLHDAIQELDDAPGKPGDIVRIVRYGYRVDTRVLRPAQVIVKA